jgi:hypothetical protein
MPTLLTWTASIHLQWEPLQIHQINLADAQQAVIPGRITIVETLTEVLFPFYHRGWHAHSRFEKRNTYVLHIPKRANNHSFGSLFSRRVSQCSPVWAYHDYRFQQVYAGEWS